MLWHVWHEESWAIALFLSWAFLYADFPSYKITSWQNNAWQELIKNCNTNPCRAHWGKFVIGTVFLCLHEQKLGLTVSLISSFRSVWTHCCSVQLFLQFSLQQQQSLFSKWPLRVLSPWVGPGNAGGPPSNLVFCNSPCSAVLSNAEFIERISLITIRLSLPCTLICKWEQVKNVNIEEKACGGCSLVFL